jgi:hypothetical protein
LCWYKLNLLLPVTMEVIRAKNGRQQVRSLRSE